MTRTKFLAWAKANNVALRASALIFDEADTIDRLVADGRLSPSKGRRQIVRLAQRLAKGRP